MKWAVTRGGLTLQTCHGPPSSLPPRSTLPRCETQSVFSTIMPQLILPSNTGDSSKSRTSSEPRQMSIQIRRATAPAIIYPVPLATWEEVLRSRDIGTARTGKSHKATSYEVVLSIRKKVSESQQGALGYHMHITRQSEQLRYAARQVQQIRNRKQIESLSVIDTYSPLI